MPDTTTPKGASRRQLYQLFKYSVYTLLFANFLYFFTEDLGASQYTFRNGIEIADLVNAFSASTDTLAWLILLLILELETYAIPDEKFTPALKWTLNGVSGICYFFILVALNGYIAKASLFYNFTPAPIADACAYVGQVISAGVRLDEYENLTVLTCGKYTAPLFINDAISMLTTEEGLSTLRRLSMLDVVNASTWVLVVLVLWVDVFLQSRDALGHRIYVLSNCVKVILYGMLVLCAVYWAFLGDVMGTWDALIWIIAFVFIEMNFIQWRREDAQEAEGTK